MKTNPKRTFIIDRSKWRTGSESADATGIGDTVLLNQEGYMCCLGHIACQLGWNKNSIYDKGDPEGVFLFGSVPKKKNVSILTQTDAYGHRVNSEFADEAIDINDSVRTTLKEKEKLLKTLGKKYGYDIKFVGEAVPYKEE